MNHEYYGLISESVIRESVIFLLGEEILKNNCFWKKRRNRVKRKEGKEGRKRRKEERKEGEREKEGRRGWRGKGREEERWG